MIIGAGPYGLAAAAHLRAAGVETRVFGETMAFWERQMPTGMLLRSYWEASHIADPDRDLTLDAYEATSCAAVPDDRRHSPTSHRNWHRTPLHTAISPGSRGGTLP